MLDSGKHGGLVVVHQHTLASLVRTAMRLGDPALMVGDELTNGSGNADLVWTGNDEAVGSFHFQLENFLKGNFIA